MIEWKDCNVHPPPIGEEVVVIGLSLSATIMKLESDGNEILWCLPDGEICEFAYTCYNKHPTHWMPIPKQTPEKQ